MNAQPTGDFTIATMMGGPAHTQPTPTAAPTHDASMPEPTTQTPAASSAADGQGPAGNPTLLIVVLLGAAFVLANISVNASASFGVSG